MIAAPARAQAMPSVTSSPTVIGMPGCRVRAHGPFNAASNHTDLSATNCTPVSPWACQQACLHSECVRQARLLQRVGAQWRDLARASTMKRRLVTGLYRNLVITFTLTQTNIQRRAAIL
jgi:hypothetical protein